MSDQSEVPLSSAPPDSVLEHAPCGFLSFGDDGTLLLANATLLDMLGYAREEIVGGRLERILTVGSRIFYQTHWFPMLRMHGRAEEIFLMLRTKAGEDLGALVNAVRHERAGAAAYDCVIMRVRERQKFEAELLRARRAAEEARDQVEEQASELELASEELRVINEELMQRTEELEAARAAADEANAAKSSFLAVMSHELRTPLNAISGYVELLELGVYGVVTDPQKDALDRIRRSQRHLLRLINDILNLARIESGHVDYLLEDVPLSELVDSVRPLMDPQLNARGLSLQSSVTPELVARMDREKTLQVLLNLMSNAIKFTEAGGTITLSADRCARDRVCLSVADTGIGIPTEKLDSVFEPFVQVDASHSRKAQGTGLGLAISRDLARGMGGDLRAASEPGKGSTFTLELPAADPGT